MQYANPLFSINSLPRDLVDEIASFFNKDPTLSTKCDLMQMSEEPLIKNLPEKNKNIYFITRNGIWYFDCNISRLEKLKFLPQKSLKSLAEKLNITKKRPATQQDLLLITDYTGHTQAPLSQLVLISRLFYDTIQYKRLTPKLLQYVAYGNQSKVKEILTLCPELLMHKGKVTDYSGRTFKKISAFQYAIWAWDTKFMAPMLLNLLPKNNKGKAIQKELQIQYEQLVNQGINYSLDGKEYNEQHFDFSSIIEKMKFFVKNFNIWADSECRFYWGNKIGHAQFLLPVHVAQFYCDPQVIYDVNTDVSQLSLSYMPPYIVNKGSNKHFWYATLKNKKLGKDLGVIRDPLQIYFYGHNDKAAIALENSMAWHNYMRNMVKSDIVLNLHLINQLHAARKDDLLALKTQLYAPISPVKQLPSPINKDTASDMCCIML